jgi:transposase
MVANPTDTKEYPAPENCEKYNQSLLLYREDILRFLFTMDVPFDNNLAERALRMFKVKNKISGCFRNSMSGEFFCRLRSFIDTCKKQKLPILDSIIYVFKFGSFQFAR